MEERPELTDLLEIWCVGGGSGAGDPVSLSIGNEPLVTPGFAQRIKWWFGLIQQCYHFCCNYQTGWVGNLIAICSCPLRK